MAQEWAEGERSGTRLAVVAVALLTFLYLQTRVIDSEHHASYLSDLRQLQELDATLNKQILEVRYAQLMYYDPLNQGFESLQSTHDRLRRVPTLVSTMGRHEIEVLLQQLDQCPHRGRSAGQIRGLFSLSLGSGCGRTDIQRRRCADCCAGEMCTEIRR